MNSNRNKYILVFSGIFFAYLVSSSAPFREESRHTTDRHEASAHTFPFYCTCMPSHETIAMPLGNVRYSLCRTRTTQALWSLAITVYAIRATCSKYFIHCHAARRSSDHRIYRLQYGVHIRVSGCAVFATVPRSLSDERNLILRLVLLMNRVSLHGA